MDQTSVAKDIGHQRGLSLVLSCARSIVEDVNGGYCPYDHSRFMSVLCMAFLRSGRIPGRFPLRPMMCLVELALFHNSGISNVIGKLGFKVVKGTDTYNAFTYRTFLLTKVLSMNPMVS